MTVDELMKILEAQRPFVGGDAQVDVIVDGEIYEAELAMHATVPSPRIVIGVSEEPQD